MSWLVSRCRDSAGVRSSGALRGPRQMAMRTHVAVAGGRFWMVGRASGVAGALRHDRVDSALTSLAVACEGPPGEAEDERHRSTFGVVDGVVGERHGRFGDTDG